ncbi:MAG: hypothetical protein Q9220_000610 [cf. Caloplaca sp. 1 TL-2023]
MALDVANDASAWVLSFNQLPLFPSALMFVGLVPCGIHIDVVFELQEKRYRSMQEHIRRAHPEHYIAKLPATEESFQLMINTPPSEKPPQPSPNQLLADTGSNHAPPETIPLFQSPRPRELLPSIMARSPPGRSTTLPPLQRKDKPQRPRKSSITQNSRKPKHERTKSKDYPRRQSIDGRKALSAEPYGPAALAQGKRWEDLLEAATSANEADSDRDLTPVCAFYHIEMDLRLS